MRGLQGWFSSSRVTLSAYGLAEGKSQCGEALGAAGCGTFDSLPHQY